MFTIERAQVVRLISVTPTPSNPMGEKISRVWQWEVSLDGKPQSYHNTKTLAREWIAAQS